MKMMNNRTKWILVASIALSTGFSHAQKKSETDAALAYRSYETAMQSADIPAARKAILKAKEFIDLAAAHPDTEKSPKTLFYKGEIYASIHLMRETPGLSDDAFTAATPADGLDIAVKAYNLSYTTSDKFDGEIETSIGNGKNQLIQAGAALYEAKKFEEAMNIYETNAKLSGAVSQIDTISIYYAGICAENAILWEKAAGFYRQCADLGYKPESIYRTTAVALINAKKNEEALSFLKNSISKSPKDKYLYYALGTIAMDMKDDALVLENLKQATVIDPKFSDAYYNLGSYFSGKGLELRTEANALPPAEKKKSDELYAKSLEFYNLAAEPLERYVELVPNEKEVLKSLFLIFRALKNTEKETKYKQLYDTAK